MLFISGKCKRFPRHLLFLLWFSWRFKIAEVNGNRAEQGSIYFCKHLHDKLLWPIGGVECIYTSQLNSTGQKFKDISVVKLLELKKVIIDITMEQFRNAKEPYFSSK